MNKPITIVRYEFAEALAKLIRETELPAFVMRQTLQQLDSVLESVEAAQFESDKAEWESQQKEDTDG